MSDHHTPLLEPASLTLLRRLVTILLVVMIIGFVVLIVTLIARLNTTHIVDVENLSLPAGVRAISYSYGSDRQIIIGDDNHLYIYDGNGALLRKVDLLEG